MWQPFVGIEAMRTGTLTRGQLRWNNTGIHPGVYLPNDVERTMLVNAAAVWLWTGKEASSQGGPLRRCTEPGGLTCRHRSK
jgi:hypothetical protein